jgi:hypothetical protein
VAVKEDLLAGLWIHGVSVTRSVKRPDSLLARAAVRLRRDAFGGILDALYPASFVPEPGPHLSRAIVRYA